MAENLKKSNQIVEAESRQNNEFLDFVRLLNKQMAFVELEINDDLSRIEYFEKMENFADRDHGGTLDLLEAYWRLFQTYDHHLNQPECRNDNYPNFNVCNVIIFQKPLAYLGKMTAVLADTVGLTMWRENQQESANCYTKEACRLIRSTAENRTVLLPNGVNCSQLGIKEFAKTKIGLKTRRVRGLFKQLQTCTADDFLQQRIVSETANVTVDSFLIGRRISIV